MLDVQDAHNMVRATKLQFLKKIFKLTLPEKETASAQKV